MSRTDRSPWGERHWYSREKPWARRMTARLERHRSREHLAHGRYDLADTRQTKRTQGWLTW